MTCRCSAPAHLDTEFARTMVLYGLPQRRWVCARGHSTTTGVPARKGTTPPAPPPPPRPKSWQLTCACGCGESFTAKSRQRRFLNNAHKLKAHRDAGPPRYRGIVLERAALRPLWGEA